MKQVPLLSEAPSLESPLEKPQFQELHLEWVVPPEDPVQLADAMLILDTGTVNNPVISPSLRQPLTHPIESARRFLQEVGLLSTTSRKAGAIVESVRS